MISLLFITRFSVLILSWADKKFLAVYLLGFTTEQPHLLENLKTSVSQKRHKSSQKILVTTLNLL